MSFTILAYLDPGSGSVLLQAILGGIAAVGVAVRLWWRQITGLFRRGGRDGDSTTENEAG